MRYCKRCVQPDPRPYVEFDGNGAKRVGQIIVGVSDMPEMKHFVYPPTGVEHHGEVIDTKEGFDVIECKTLAGGQDFERD